MLVVGTLASLFLPPHWDSCNKESPPVSVQRFPDHVVFTAKVVMVGFPVDAFYRTSSWSIVRVERRYWGWPSWAPNFVILRTLFNNAKKGDEYFVDGRRSEGLLTHFVPIVEHYACCHTERLDYAAVDLRVLEDGPPRSGVRIIGRVGTDLVGFEPARGVKLLVTGPDGKTTTTTTDQQGIYDLVGLPEGHYSVLVESESQRRYFYKIEGDVKSGEVWGYSLIAWHAQTSPR